MIKRVCAKACQSKNMLMLITASIYILALFSTLSSQIPIFALLITGFFLISIFKEYFPLKYIIIWCLIFYFGIINTSFRIKDVDALLNLAPVNSEIFGTIVSIPQGKPENKPKFFFNVNKINLGSVQKEFKNEKILVTINTFDNNSVNYEDLKLYNSFVLKGRLSMPFKAGNPSQFDYGNYLRNHNTYAVFYANELQKIGTSNSFKTRFMQNINDYREEILSIHSKYIKSPNLEILGGIVFGDDAVSPPKNIKQSFVNSGLLHILAASGMNVAFIYGFFFMIMSVLRINYKIRIVSSMIMVLVYSLMTGLGASVIRATCMLIFVLLGKLIDRDANSISLLSFVALLMLIYNPLFINDVGFQLSFIVTFGILVMAPAFTRAENKIIDFILSCITIPVIAQLWVIPIQIFYFNNISLYSVLANIMSVPILMVVSFGGFLSSLLAGIKPISDLICRTFDFILSPFISFIVNISDFWGKLPHSAIQTSHPCVFQIIIYYAVLLGISVLLYKDLREKYFKQIIKFVASLLLILFMTFIPIKNSNLEITAFDVGNADCFLIKTPDNRYSMIDTGKSGYNGGKSQAEIIVIKYLKDLGIKELDNIIITHFDNDHCGGTVDLINNLKVKNIYVNNLNHKSLMAKDIYKAANSRNVKLILSQNNQNIYNKSGVSLVNYKAYTGKSDNDNSIITLLRYGNFTMLFTGDAGINGIGAVLKYIPQNITVFKVPHHGAVGGVNREIISYLKPEYSLISTGENKFGHPSLYTLSFLEKSKIIRTDIDNSLRISVNKNNYRILGYDIKKRKYVLLK